VPAKRQTRCMAPAPPVFAGTPAPTRDRERSRTLFPVRQRSPEGQVISHSDGAGLRISWSLWEPGSLAGFAFQPKQTSGVAAVEPQLACLADR